MGEAGRPTDMTDELVKQIKQSILDGNDLKTTANICGIDPQKLYNWNSDNYLEISDKIDGWKRDYKLSLADKNINDILKIGAVPNKVTLKVVADMSKFVKETLDRDNYSKRTETDLTSKGAKIAGFNYITPNDNRTEDNNTELDVTK